MTSVRFCSALFAFTALGLSAATLQFEGTLGNSGEFNRPVRFAPSPDNLREIAAGVVYDDDRGILYERVAPQQINAYTLDGRLAAEYKIPKLRNESTDAMVRCGDYLVLLLNGKLYRLKLNAPDGAEVEPVPTTITAARYVSGSAWQGRLAVLDRSGKVHLLDPATGKSETWADYGKLDLRNCDFDADGSLILISGRSIYKITDGKVVEDSEWPRRLVGNREGTVDRLRRFGDYWYGSAWNATIKRFDSDFQPAPGVILGGGGGHFIGYVPANFDAENPRGLAEIRPGLLAIGGMNGIIQLASWRPEIKRLQLLRRIGALPRVGALEITGDGKVFSRQHLWRWSDDALSPAWLSLRETAELPAAYFDADNFITLGTRYNQTAFFNGKLEEQKTYTNIEKPMPIPKDPIGVAVYRQNPNGTGPWIFVAMNARGEAVRSEVYPDRRPWRKTLGPVTIATAQPVKEFTALRSIPGNHQQLFAAADNQLIELVRDGDNWREKSRWSDQFGTGLEFAISGNRLLVSDPANHRVAVYTLSDHRKLAEFKVNQPGRVAMNGPFVAVYEQDNQRILKFRLEE